MRDHTAETSMPRHFKTSRIDPSDTLICAFIIAWNLGSVAAIGAALRGLVH
jgi:hypothetical protein